ncbi:MAG: Arc family DNA-binding protein [Pseudomonadota bacterium]
MPSLSIKDVPAATVERLRQRAKRNHRSLQGELMTIIDEALKREQFLSPREVLAEAKRLGLNSPSESVQIIRELRDSR